MLVLDDRLTRRVGAVTLLLLAGAVGFVVFIYDQIEWRRHVRIGVYFHDTGGLREGAPLVVGGREIGTIETVALAPRDVQGPLGGDEGVVVTVAIPAREAARVTRGGDVFVTSRGPLGARYLEIGPAATAGPSLAEDPRPLLGRDPPSIDRVLQRTWDNLTVARVFGEAVGPELALLRVRIAELGATLDGLVPNVAGMASLGLEVTQLVAEARRLRDVSLGGEPGLAQLAAV
nr:MCE family protein [Myxococcota bacterium]